MRRPSSVTVGLGILLAAVLGGTVQGVQINTRADRLSDTVESLSDTVALLNGRVVDCLDPGGRCKAANDAATVSAVDSIVQRLHDDIDASLTQLQADLERLRLGQRVIVTPLPPVVAMTMPTTVPPTPTMPTTVLPTPTPDPPTICLPLGVVTVGCTS